MIPQTRLAAVNQTGSVCDIELHIAQCRPVLHQLFPTVLISAAASGGKTVAAQGRLLLQLLARV